MTKYTEEKNRRNKPVDTPIVAGAEEWYAESRPPYICDFCKKTLNRLVDRSGFNQSWYCSTCQAEYDPETELRSKTQLTMSDGPVTNPSVSYAVEPQLKRKTVEYKGTFKALRDKGINITSYKEGKG